MAAASDFCAYAKERLRDLNLIGPGQVRVSHSGCLGRCGEGPSLVIYPEGTWYAYKTRQDIDEIIDSHVLNGRVVSRLLMVPPPKQTSPS